MNDQPTKRKPAIKVKTKEAPVNIEVASKNFIDSAKKSIGEILAEQFNIALTSSEIEKMVAVWKQNIADGKYSVTDLKDTEAYNNLVRARALFRTTRTAIEKRRKELKAVPNEMGKAIDNYAKGLTELVEPIEMLLDKEVERVDAEKERIKIEKEKAEQEFMDNRIKQLIDVGCAFDGSEYTLGEFSTFTYDIRTANEEEFIALVASAKVEADKLVEKKAELERLQKEADEKHQRELAQIEEGKKLHAEAEKKLQAEKEEFDRKQAEELEKFFKEKQEIERQKQELIDSKRSFRTQQLLSVGYKEEVNDNGWSFANKYGTGHHINSNCFVLDDLQWNEVIKEARERKCELLIEEENRDEKERKELEKQEENRKGQREKEILEQRTKDRIAQLEAEGFAEVEGSYVFIFQASEISVASTFIIHSEPIEWNRWFFEKKSAIDFKKQQVKEKNAIALMSDTNKVNKWIEGVELAVGSVDSSWIENSVISSELDLAKLTFIKAISLLRIALPKPLVENGKAD